MIAEVIPVAVPLRRRDGSTRAVALVDAQDFDAVNERRWSLSNGYASSNKWDRVARKQHTTPMHRLILGLPPKTENPIEVDHVNGNRLDNRRSNLRLCTRKQNGQNLGLHGGSSRYRGVWWSKSNNAWCVMVKLNGEPHYLGQFKDEDEAGLAAQRFREEHMTHTNESRYAGVGQ